MNRNQRRIQEREINKGEKLLNKLSPQELFKIDEIIKERAKERTILGTQKIEEATISVLLDIDDIDLKEIEEINEKVFERLKEDRDFNKKIKEEKIDMVKLSLEIKDFILSKMVEGKDKKKIIDSAAHMFPTVSKTEISKNYIEVKKEFMKGNIKEIPETIIKCQDGIATVTENKFTKKSKVEGNVEDKKKLPIKEEKVEVKTSLEVIEEIKTIKLKGKNGNYLAQSGIGVSLENKDYKLSFSNLEELNIFIEEIKEVFSKI